MELFVSSTKMGPMEEDQAFAIACDWDDVVGFLKYPRQWIADLRAREGAEKTKAIALPPAGRPATFVCRFEPGGHHAQRIRADVVVEGTLLSDLMVVHAVPDSNGPEVQTVYRCIRPNHVLDIKLRPSDGLGYAHLSIPNEDASDFVLEALRNPYGFVAALNKLIDEGSARVEVEPGTEDPNFPSPPTVRIATPTQESLQSALFLLQVGCPEGAFICSKNGGSIAPIPGGTGYELTLSTMMVTCYFAPA